MTSTDGSSFKIVLESEIGNSESGDIAIDDVTVFSGSCPQGMGLSHNDKIIRIMVVQRSSDTNIK